MRTPSSSKRRLDLAPPLADRFILGFPIDYGPVLLLMPFGFHLTVDTLPSEVLPQWLQIRLGCIRLSPSCPFRRLHTFCFLRPARRYSRFWIRHPSFGCLRDFNPPGRRAAQHTLRILRFGLLQDGKIGVSVFPIAPENCDMRRELLADLPTERSRTASQVPPQSLPKHRDHPSLRPVRAQAILPLLRL